MSFDSQVTFVYTDDLPATHAFWHGSLGLELVLDQGSCRIYRVASDAYLGFCDRPDAVGPDGFLLTLVDAEVEARCAALAEQGVTFEVECRYNAEYDITQAFLRDPNGVLVELQRFESPDWPG